jgi:hypothetical protein
MSDPKTSSGDPVEEPTPVDDIVGRANEGLADAEAAGAASAPIDEPAQTVDTDERPSAANEWAAEEPAWASDPAASAPEQPVEADAATTAYDSTTADAGTTAEAATTAYEAETVAYAPVVTPSEPAVAVAPAVVAPQPIFVQAPEAPRPKGNRAAAGAIGLVAALAFAGLYLAVWLGVGAIDGTVTAENAGTAAVAALGTWALWVPTVVFFLSFWLVGAIINRGRWGVWVHIGLLVGFAAYAGHLLGQLFQAPFWSITASEGAQLVEGQLLAPLAVAAFIIARELTIWFGAWAAARGRRVTELNLEAQHEYERTLEAGPQLVRQ